MNIAEPANVLGLLFLSNQRLDHELARIETDFAIDLGRNASALQAKDEDFYPQLEQELRAEAASMAPHYEVFYALENSIRKMVIDSLEASEGGGWWSSSRIPPNIRTEAEARHRREVDTGMTTRSSEMIDYTTFGELGEVIKSNWDVFSALFSSKKAVEKIVTSLNSLRGPIAHCSPLAEDEIVRLRLTVRDWFRLMG
jgi:Swt1-like HEPN